jgi:hypothetical protein
MSVDTTIMDIANKFRYVTDIPIEDIIKNATEKLDIKYEKMSDDSYIIITKSLKQIYDSINKLDKDYYIPTDCRFFAILIASLKEYPESASIFTMHINKNGLEINIPKHCIYITLDSDKFVLKSKTGGNPTFVTSSLGTDQGQWITKCDETNYIGIVDEGAVVQKLDSWVERYRYNVEKHIANYNIKDNHQILDSASHAEIIKKSYDGLLNTLVKMYGISICAYRFNNYFNETPFVDILKENNTSYSINLPPPSDFCDEPTITPI